MVLRDGACKAERGGFAVFFGRSARRMGQKKGNMQGGREQTRRRCDEGASPRNEIKNKIIIDKLQDGMV